MTQTFVTVTVTCPNCGHKQPFTLPHHINQNKGLDKPHPTISTHPQDHQVVLCYPEEGGCDRHFVVKHKLTATAQTFTIDDSNDDTDKLVGIPH